MTKFGFPLFWEREGRKTGLYLLDWRVVRAQQPRQKAAMESSGSGDCSPVLTALPWS